MDEESTIALAVCMAVVGVLLIILIQAGLWEAGIGPFFPLSKMLAPLPSYLTGSYPDSLFPDQPSITSELEALTKVVKLGKAGKEFRAVPVPNGDEDQGAENCCKVMLQATSAPPVSGDPIPDDLQGIFWMDGNGVPELLAAMDDSIWVEKENMLVRRSNDRTWSWANEGPGNGKSMNGQSIAVLVSPQSGLSPTGRSVFKFEDSSLQRGRVWMTVTDKLDDVKMPRSAHWTLERISGLPAGAVDFKRGIYWYKDVCGGVEFGSYRLRKIMQKDGTKIQPAYGDFVKFMGTRYPGMGQLLLEEENTPVPLGEVESKL